MRMHSALLPWLLISGVLPLLSVFAFSAHGSIASAASPPNRSSAARDPDDPLEALRPDLHDPSARTRRQAVRALAAVGTPAAWRLVTEALGDEESEVADAAQLALGSLPHPDVLEELLGARGLRSRAPGVRERVAEALGRMALELDVVTLSRRLSTRPPDREFTRMLLWTIERQGIAGRLVGQVERAVRTLRSITASRRGPRLRAEALLALAVLEPGGTRELRLEAVGDREPVLRCAALEAEALAGGERSLSWARVMASDEEPVVRTQAVVALEALASPAALAVLVNRLDIERELALRWRLLTALRRLTGMKYRFDARPWKAWLEGLDETWAPLPESSRPVPSGSRAKSLTGLPVRSDRVTFLFDFSGSMWTPLEDGRTPKAVVEVELRRALEGLAEHTRFNLIPFTYDPIPWKSALVTARKPNVRGALEFYGRCNARGRGNFYDAALLALEDPDVDTLVVLTDGVPTGGTHNDMDLVAPLLLRELQLRSVTLDVILVDAPYGAQRRWRELAARTGGTATEVQLGGY